MLVLKDDGWYLGLRGVYLGRYVGWPSSIDGVESGQSVGRGRELKLYLSNVSLSILAIYDLGNLFDHGLECQDRRKICLTE